MQLVERSISLTRSGCPEKMLPRKVMSEFRPRPRPAQGNPSVGNVFIFIRVDSRYALLAHHALSRCHISSIEIDSAACHHQNITYRVGLHGRFIDELMYAVMEHIPEAQFGRIIIDPSEPVEC